MNKLYILVLVFFAISIPSFAYLDPGTGSYMFQIMIAGIAGVGYTVKIFWKNIVEVIKKIFKNKKEE